MMSNSFHSINIFPANCLKKYCIQHLFEKEVEERPDAIALVFEEQQLSYRALDERANQLGHYLQDLGVKVEIGVGICLERSVEMIISVLAILKAGGTYIPLDPLYPQERLAFIAQDADLHFVLTNQQNAGKLLQREEMHIINLAREDTKIRKESQEKLTSYVIDTNAAYSIYTSGSTGTPKGVLIEHKSIGNLVQAQSLAFKVQQSSRVLQFASLSFDASVSEIFVALLTGATLVLISQQQRVTALQHVLQLYAITTVTLPPSIARLLVPEELTALDTLIVAGEICSQELARQWTPTHRFFNAYGPTETTVCASFMLCKQATPIASVPIGYPIDNTQIYLLDQQLQPVPSGVVGELYIGGIGLARGYSNHLDFTAERFLPDPFCSQPGARFYRTGDRARRLSDGTLEFVGRVDQQVKLRGFRIELGEIEVVLCQHPAIQQAVVLLREDEPDSKQLVSYFVVRPTHKISVDGISSFLRQRLPDYMLPSVLMTLEALPLLPNGKIDRQSLPLPERRSANDERATPRTSMEEILVDLWTEVLDLEEVGLHDNFFALGGHSLIASQVITRLHTLFHIDLPLNVFLKNPTIEGLAVYLSTLKDQTITPSLSELQASIHEGPQPLSYAQQRVWFFDRLLPENPFYTMSITIDLQGLLPSDILELSLKEVVRRHEILRTIFPLFDGQAQQVVLSEVSLSLPIVDLQALSPSEQTKHVQELATVEAQHPFDLTQGPLLRVCLLRLSPVEQALLLTVHHIVYDGWSMGILLGEIGHLYTAYLHHEPSPLQALPIQYIDFCIWQRQQLQGERLQLLLTYWRKQLAGAPTFLMLPTDYPRPSHQRGQGAMQARLLPLSLLQLLKKLGQQEGATLFMTLLSAFYILLNRYSRQDDLLVGTPIAHRADPKIEPLIGLFINMLILRGQLSGNPSFCQLLQQVRETTLAAYAHQDLPFERLIEELQPERDLSCNPLFQVMFALHNHPQPLLTLPDLVTEITPGENQTAMFDLSLEVRESAQGLYTVIRYDTDLFAEVAIERLLGHWQTLLEGIVTHPERHIADLPLLTEAEQYQLLLEWNTDA